ncbi:MAG: hypothetical protein JNL01_09605 [Bdellovibrionales bacterium]|nr:hypothetical protein [Bdellovibrionales bacterium]
MANADIVQKVGVSKDRFMATLVDYAAYPEFVEGAKKVDVSKVSDTVSRVAYQISMMGQDIQYTLEHTEDRAAGEMSWILIESNFLKKNAGKWSLKDLGGDSCEVRYEIEIEFTISVPSFILNRLVKGSLPSMIKSFEKQAKG